MIYTDQMMREIRLNKPPSRIVCLVPSITELLYDLGLFEEIVGITKFCIHPEKIYRSKQRVGGTKKIDPTVVDQLTPDLIIANKEENTREDIELLEKKYPVWISDIKTLDDAVQMISMLGEITGKQQAANDINSMIESRFRLISKAPGVRTLYIIWKNPYMVAGSETFINDMLDRCGFENVLKHSERYPSLDASQIRELNPELVLLSSEPYPFKEKHILEIKEIVPDSMVELADGEYFSWYGSRLTGAPSYFNKLISKLNHQNPATSLYEN